MRKVPIRTLVYTSIALIFFGGIVFAAIKIRNNKIEASSNNGCCATCGIDQCAKTFQGQLNTYSYDKRWWDGYCDCSSFIYRVLYQSGMISNPPGSVPFYTGTMVAEWDAGRNDAVKPAHIYGTNGVMPECDLKGLLRPGDIIIYNDPDTGKPDQLKAHTGIVSSGYDEKSKTIGLIHCTSKGGGVVDVPYETCRSVYGIYRTTLKAVQYHPNTRPIEEFPAGFINDNRGLDIIWHLANIDFKPMVVKYSTDNYGYATIYLNTWYDGETATVDDAIAQFDEMFRSLDAYESDYNIQQAVITDEINNQSLIRVIYKM